MTETATAGVRQADESAADQAKEKVQEKAIEVKGQAGDRVRRELDARSTDAGQQLGLTASAMRRSGEQLRSEGNQTPAAMVTAVADRAERLGGYLTEANADQILWDVENFARRQPLLFVLGGATIGFLAARFMKASSRSRYERSNGSGTYGAGSQTSSREAPVARPAGQPGQGAGVYTTESSMTEDLTPAATSSERGGGSGKSAQ
ncbi:MAG: hypothetical protein K0S82_149 [Gaiellaceae bacterium]|nr:hypothetical protein [Gaiellaceae bacterium]